MENENDMRIIELRAENVKRLQSVHIRPAGAVVVIGGKNAQGKSSTLDAIEMALGGASTIPPDPIRHGARKGRVVVDLGELVVERTFTAKGSSLTVTGKDGTPQKSPQALLDSLCSSVAFDPVAFCRMDPAKQDDVLKRALGLDFTELDKDRAALFSSRRDIKRDAKALEARVRALPVPEAGTPEGEISVSALAEELQRGRQLHDQAAEAEREVRSTESVINQLGARIEELRQALRDSEMDLEDAVKLRTARAEAAARLHRAATDIDLGVLTERIRTADTTNAKVRQARERFALEAQLREMETKVADYTAAIEGIDEKKASALAAAEFPVPGLGFSDVGPTLNGAPLEQASQAEKLRLSVAIGAALHPRLRVMLLRDGSVLDDDGMRLLAELAEEHDLQLWLERVGDKDRAAVIIEDGMVLARETAGEAAQ